MDSHLAFTESEKNLGNKKKALNLRYSERKNDQRCAIKLKEGIKKERRILRENEWHLCDLRGK